jgi:hypothetical protein
MMCSWVTAIVLQALLAAIMSHRGLARKFPAFFAYTTYEVLLNAFLFTIDHIDSVTATQYWDANLVGAAGSAALRFAVVCEIFIQVFRIYPPLKELGEVVFRWATVVLMIVAVLIVAKVTGLEGTGFEKDWPVVGLHIVDRAIDMIQCGLLVFLTLLAGFLRLSLRSYIMGIALGFGVFSSVELLILALQAQYGVDFGLKAVPLVRSVTYLWCLGIWMATVLSPEHPKNRKPPPRMQDLNNWNDTLERLIRQ